MPPSLNGHAARFHFRPLVGILVEAINGDIAASPELFLGVSGPTLGLERRATL